ncbi:MAG: transcriptional regulator [Gammaproteobacteria bacterium]|nr:transcriptional regulator [Gammaproteobacteria bacterium]
MNTTTAAEQLQNEETNPQVKSLRKRVITPFVFVRDHYFSIAVIALLLFGWSNRNDNYLSAETGMGYALGIIGGIFMLLVSLYPLSKRVAWMSRWIRVRYWFLFHMVFGIIGPVMVLFHANFHIGSLNSTVALVSMLVVVSSGLIARYIYTRIHHGLYGQRITLKELKHELDNEHTELLRILEIDEKLKKRLTAMESRAFGNYTSLSMSLIHAISMAIDTRRLESGSIRLLKKSKCVQTPTANSEKTKKFIHRYTDTLRHIAEFRVYERLFSWWHILHMPLFIMMIITAIIHIFAVHLY